MDWSSLRSLFPVTRRWAFLDHAAVSPLPQPVVDASAEYSRSLAENGVAEVRAWIDRIREVRELAARLINAPSANDVIFVGNTTQGIGLIAEGFPWQSGDNVVTAAEEYPSNLYPWMNLASRGVETRRVPSRGNRVAVDDLAAAMDGRTRVLAISAVEYASGYRNDLDALGELCQKKGIFFFVDAIQSLGVMPLDVQKTPIDALSADGHKWLLGPEGAGIAYIRREWVERLHAIGVGWNSVVQRYDFNSIDLNLFPHAGRWEGGSPNVVGITGLGASLKLLLDLGIPAIEERIVALTDELCSKAATAGLDVFSSRDPREKSGIVSLVKPGASAAELMKRCRQAGVIVNNRAHRLRVSPHVYSTSEDLDRFLDVVR